MKKEQRQADEKLSINSTELKAETFFNLDYQFLDLTEEDWKYSNHFKNEGRFIVLN